MTGMALLGAGRMGQVHAAAIAAAGTRLAAVYDPASRAAEALAARTVLPLRATPLKRLPMPTRW